MFQRRALFALLGCSFALSVGCSGGSSGGAPPAPSGSATPKATPVPIKSLNPSGPPATSPIPIITASPTPMPTQAPSAAAIGNASRPLHNGDAYTYVGTTQQNVVYGGASPKPAASTLVSIQQSIAVSSNASYAGTPGLYDFKTNETDSSALQNTTLSTDTYYGTIVGANLTYLVDYGFTSANSLGEKLGVTATNAGPLNGLVDVLPETGGAAWSNSGAQKIVQSESDGFSATRTYGSDGSYVDSATYPQAGVANPAATPLTATIATKADGSATYVLPLFGLPNVTVTYGAPSANGAISIAITQPGPNPTSTPIVVQSTAVGAWYQQPLHLYQELDRDNGAVAIPAACNVPATYGTQANEIEQKSVRADPVLGTLESFDQLTYVIPTSGAVCVQLRDNTLTYYDYSGQGNGSPTGITYAGGNSPLETATIATTVGLTGATISPLSVRHTAGGNGSGLRLATARNEFRAVVEGRRIAAQRRAFQRLRASILERTTR